MRRCQKELGRLDGRVKGFKQIVVATFDEQCDSGLHTLNYHIPDPMVEDLRTFGALSVLDGTIYEYFNVHIKYAYRRTSQRRQTRRMKP